MTIADLFRRATQACVAPAPITPAPANGPARRTVPHRPCHVMPDVPRGLSCQCVEHTESSCICHDTIKALRAWYRDKGPLPMTPAQRRWCVAQIAAVPGCDPEEFGPSERDCAVAGGVLDAWVEHFIQTGEMTE